MESSTTVESSAAPVKKEPKAKKRKATVPIPATKLDSEIENCPPDRICLGICAMDKKARSQPMAEILSRMDERCFRVVFFGDDVIKHKPVEEWPCCDVLIAFHSFGYPLEKAREYADLRKPVILNDLEMQEVIKDRRKVYDLLEASGIDVPRHVYVSRDGYQSNGSGAGNGNNETELVEYDDHIECNGIDIHKPFVEKPVDSDDHNINIYYPSAAGGGCKKLFRKIGNRSSEFYPNIHEVRREGSYIYEEFVETQGTDVKMYTVGPEYGHAEARKSPTVDGKVERNEDGKEVRFPVILTVREKEIARRIVLGFKQMVCGFDLLRVQEGDSIVSYVCDVNGWSFVKKSRKYYDDCAQILTELMLARVKPTSLKCFSTLGPLVTTQGPNEEELDNSAEGLDPNRRGFQRRVSLLLLEENKEVTGSPRRAGNPWSGSASATMLQDGAIPVRDIPDTLTSEPASIAASSTSSQVDEGEYSSPPRASRDSKEASVRPTVHQEELRCVIAVVRHGDRTPKQKLKVNTTEPPILEFFRKYASSPKKDVKVKARAPMIEFLETVKEMIATKQLELQTARQKELLFKLLHMRDVLERWRIVGLNRKLQIKPREWEEVSVEEGKTELRCTSVQLILKWGGNLTKLGEKQAINLGKRFRHEMYPEGPGGGILRLHSTFRHDLKIKTSDEGRVMKTAAAFAKGLLELEGEITPILVSLVHKEKDSMHMLDPSGNKEVKMELDECKEKLNKNLQRDIEVAETPAKELAGIVGPPNFVSLHKALAKVGNPRKALCKIHETVGELTMQLEDMLGLIASGDEIKLDGEGLKGSDDDVALSGVKLYKGETLLELTERWRFIHQRLYDEDKDTFDLSRIPDVHDNVRFDMLHNPHLGLTATLQKLYELAKEMADCVVPQEYGTTLPEKRSIGSKMCGALLEKIKYDLAVAKKDDKVDMRDMRYMINMDYGNDLHINTMGRRVRTRLYFTSESHLHTMLNVLRSGATENSRGLLSKKGRRICNEAPELCYLTQIVFRLFEDISRDAEDPKRFRVEVMFSPGATATPMHMAEMDRDSDSSRYDTDKLEMIGRHGLTFEEVESFFSEVIEAGKSNEEEHYEVASMSSNMDGLKKHLSLYMSKNTNETKPTPTDTEESAPTPKTEAAQEKQEVVSAPSTPTLKAVEPEKVESRVTETSSREVLVHLESPTNGAALASVPETQEVTADQDLGTDEPATAAQQDTNEKDSEPTEMEVDRTARILARKYYWRTVSAASVVLGTGLLFLSMNIRESGRYERRWSRR